MGEVPEVKVAIALAAACVVVVGCSTGASGAPDSASVATARGGHRLVAGQAPSAPGGRVHLTDYADSDSPTSSVILTGAIGDFGSATLDQTTGRFVLRLSHGSFTLRLAELDARFLAKLRKLPVNQSSCSAFAEVAGTVPIVFGAGTGSYAHLTGAFALTVTLDEVFRAGACSEQSPYAAQKIITSGWGTVHNH